MDMMNDPKLKDPAQEQIMEQQVCSAGEQQVCDEEIYSVKEELLSASDVPSADQQKQKNEEPPVEKLQPMEEPEAPLDAEVSIPVLDLPKPVADFQGNISAFGFSLQGESHIQKMMPCQDRSHVCFLSDKVVAAAVADGVGSCALSDYGSDTAVRAAIDFLKANLQPKLQDPAFVIDGKIMGELFRKMMRHAYDQVEARAEAMEQLLYSLQSTLTVAVYDGTNLYYAHAGDDGIVAQTRDGHCEMVTSRHKGEEASSVYPLQNTSTWQYGMVADAVAFVMATDGVLDAFVRGEVEQNRVYYPFVEPAFYTPLSSAEETAAACGDWVTYMQSPRYRDAVTDDLSMVCVVNQAAIKTSVKPAFDLDAWNKKSEEFAARRKAALYPPKSQEQPRRTAQTAPNSGAARPAQSVPQGNPVRPAQPASRGGAARPAQSVPQGGTARPAQSAPNPSRTAPGSGAQYRAPRCPYADTAGRPYRFDSYASIDNDSMVELGKNAVKFLRDSSGAVLGVAAGLAYLMGDAAKYVEYAVTTKPMDGRDIVEGQIVPEEKDQNQGGRG